MCVCPSSLFRPLFQPLFRPLFRPLLNLLQCLCMARHLWSVMQGRAGENNDITGAAYLLRSPAHMSSMTTMGGPLSSTHTANAGTRLGWLWPKRAVQRRQMLRGGAKKRGSANRQVQNRGCEESTRCWSAFISPVTHTRTHACIRIPELTHELCFNEERCLVSQWHCSPLERFRSDLAAKKTRHSEK